VWAVRVFGDLGSGVLRGKVGSVSWGMGCLKKFGRCSPWLHNRDREIVPSQEESSSCYN